MKFRLPQCFCLSVTCPLFNVLLEFVFQVLLNMTLFVGSRSFISPPSFMFVSAAVSEIRELNQNKKKKTENNNSISNLTPLLGI